MDAEAAVASRDAAAAETCMHVSSGGSYATDYGEEA